LQNADSVNPTDLLLINIEIKGTPVNEKLILFFSASYIMFIEEEFLYTDPADKIFCKRN
jgi:hypothetical protein